MGFILSFFLPIKSRFTLKGSRDRLCIHKELRPRNNVNRTNKLNVNINTACQIRVRNTESFRKYGLREPEIGYDDNSPPVLHPGDIGTSMNMNNNEEEAGDGNDVESQGNRLNGANVKMCPHYRQLTSEALAKKVHSAFVPDRYHSNCCSQGGEKTKLGSHDIEDLVRFGTQPNIKRGVALYRNPSNPSYGLKLGQEIGTKGSIVVREIPVGGAADKEGTIEVGHSLVSVNGTDVTGGHEISTVTRQIREAKDPLLLDTYGGETMDIDVDEYSEESACPYYLSRVLAKNAEIVFCPYNYVLDPNIRAAMDIEVENSILILDEAHNVEDTLRSEGSGKFGEIELLEMNVLLANNADNWVPENHQIGFGRRQREESLHDKIPELSHTILVFLDKVIDAVKESREGFENDRGKWHPFHFEHLGLNFEFDTQSYLSVIFRLQAGMV